MKKLELVRDFIGDCLYNPNYGYFSKNVQIFKCSVPFNQLRDQTDYHEFLARAYEADNPSSTDSGKDAVIGHAPNSLFYRLQREHKQQFAPLWHTPSELFQPFYGRSIANFLLQTQQLKEQKLVIYELGPGNGTLAKDILDSLDEAKVPVEYNLLEVSDKLKRIQRVTLKNYDVRWLNWPNERVDDRPCVVLAMEVFDNLAHDLIKYRNEDGVLLEGCVGSDEEAAYGSVPGKLWLEWRECQDVLIREFVQEAERVGWQSPSLRGTPLRRLLERVAPPNSYTNPWSTEFVPTGAFELLKRLKICFPKHSLLASDFYKLPDAIAGHNGPVVQTRLRNQSVACSTFLLARGLFDIFFPVNFDLLSKLHGRPTRRIWPHRQFLQEFASNTDISSTTTRSGYNPMLQDFTNVQFYYATNGERVQT